MRTSRYGASNRKLIDKAYKSKRAGDECPKCRKPKLVRKGNSLWVCKSCGATFAGAAYSFESETGQIAKRLMADYAKGSA